MPVEFLADLEDHGTTVAMDVDDAEALEIFGGTEGPIAALDHRLISLIASRMTLMTLILIRNLLAITCTQFSCLPYP